MRNIRIGISGWRYAPWRGVFYPKDLPQRLELAFASRALPTIEMVTVSALQMPANGKPQRYIMSAQADRERWSSLHSNGSVTADQAIRCLGQLGARCNLTALGAFLAVEPFD